MYNVPRLHSPRGDLPPVFPEQSVDEANMKNREGSKNGGANL